MVGKAGSKGPAFYWARPVMIGHLTGRVDRMLRGA